MRSFKIILALVILVSFLVGCGGSEKPDGPKKVYFPEWWNIQDNPDYVYTFGLAEKVSQNPSYDAAYANAMLSAAQYVEAQVKGMVKNYEEESGVENPQVLALTSKVVKAISKAKFSNAMVNKQETIISDNGRYKTFVRVSIPKDTINKNLVNQIKNEEALYNAFKASQAFKELEKETKN